MTFRTPAPWERKKKQRKKPRTKFERQVATLDKWFSLCVRFEAADALGECTCVTCGKKFPWKGGGIHAGHFIPKANNTFRTRWDVRNVKPQCADCNSWKEGRKYEFGEYLKQEYGPNIIRELKLKASEHFNPDYYGMQEHIDHYRNKFNLMIKQAGLKK